MLYLKQKAFTWTNIGVLLIIGFFTLYPFWNIFAVSLNQSLDTLKGDIYFFPRAVTLDNFRIILVNNSLIHATINSILRTVLGTVGGVFCCMMLAYTLSRKDYVLRTWLNTVLVISLYVNGGIIPTYMLIKSLHLTNDFLVYLLPNLINAFNVIILRSYLDQLPPALSESAKIDGASDMQLLFRILIPICMPAIATITLFVAVLHWNSWFDNYLYISNPKLNVLQFELMKILMSSVSEVTSSATGHIDSEKVRAASPQSIRAAMTVIVTLPILLVYPFLQKYFIKGMTIGAVKE